jgi:pseudaminic acid synthase
LAKEEFGFGEKYKLLIAVRLRGQILGSYQPCYIIAEMSANHGGSLEKAIELVRAAKESGADAIKLQTYTPDTLTLDCRRPEFIIGKGTPWEGRNLYELYRGAYTPWEWQPKLKAEADRLGIDCFSTPFDETAVDFLEKMEVPAHKIASFELVDTELIRKVASTGKPVIMSTGMGTFEEITEAVQTLRAAGCTQFALLKCTSAYPAPAEEMNLRTIAHMSAEFGVPVGLSDHTMGIAVPVAAVAMGACIIEKHITLSRADGGPDSTFSLEPSEFRAMVEAVRIAEAALGGVSYDITEKERNSRRFRRSLFVVRDMQAGDVFSCENVRSIRPGYGLPVKELADVLGRTAKVAIARGTPLSREHF